MLRTDKEHWSTAVSRPRALPCPLISSPVGPSGLKVQTGNTTQSPCPSTSVTFLNGAQNVNLEGVNFYYIQGDYNDTDGRGVVIGESTGTIKDVREVDCEDVPLEREVYEGSDYRLHVGQTSGNVVVVKLFQGSNAKERCKAEAELYLNKYHSNIPHLIAISRVTSQSPFLVFQGDCDGPLDGMLSQALRKGLKASWIMGLKTVAGLSAGLNYLSDTGFQFASVSIEDFILLSSAGKLVVSFEQKAIQTGKMDRKTEANPLENLDLALAFFNLLCQKTFDAARKAHYESEQVISSITEEDSSAGDLSSVPSLEAANIAALLAEPTLIPHSMRGFAQPRLELIWKSVGSSNATLHDISSRFQLALASSSSLSDLNLASRRGRYKAKTSHRCPGYNRVEISLTSDIARSAIISHSTPVPSEICLVCNQVVRTGEVFNCKCGKEDDELIPTTRCTLCFEWHHQSCVQAAGLDPVKFVCEKCGFQISQSQTSVDILQPHQVPQHQMHEKEQRESESPSSGMDMPRLCGHVQQGPLETVLTSNSVTTEDYDPPTLLHDFLARLGMLLITSL